LLVDLLGRHLLEVPLERRTGVVDDHVDPSEPFHRSVHGRLCIFDAGDIELEANKLPDSPRTVAISSG
jgi:hypothetical protein